MKWSISSIVMSAVVVGMLCIPRVAAASGSLDASGGRITFTGAIVEPTCSVNAEVTDTVASMPASHEALQRRFRCGSAQSAVESGQFYSLTVVRLDAAATNHDRVLEYFAGYLKTTGSNEATAKLFTRTFE